MGGRMAAHLTSQRGLSWDPGPSCGQRECWTLGRINDSFPFSLQPQSGGSRRPNQAWLIHTSFSMTRVRPRAGAMAASHHRVVWATPPPRPRPPSWPLLCPTWRWSTGAAWLLRARSWWIRTCVGSQGGLWADRREPRGLRPDLCLSRSTASSLSASSSTTSPWTRCTWARSWDCSSFPTFTR